MSCLKPMIAWRYKTDSFWYDKKVHIVAEKELSEYGKNAYLRHERISVAPSEIEWLELPCGKCIQCRLQYSRNWADRCMLEAQQYDYNDFITLTYDQEHLPHNYKHVDVNGECPATLDPKDLQDFVKRLRQVFTRGQYRVTHENGKKELLSFDVNDNIRFYACGEYGDQTSRPHYHLIIFNLKVPDLKFWYTNKQGHAVYRSDLLESIWQKGIVTCAGSVCWDMCAYVARYVMKKQKGSGAAEYYANKGIVPEFVRMSRKPGIGRKYFDDNGKKIYQYDAIWIKKYDKLVKLKPSRYYDKLYDVIDSEHLEQIKEARKERGKIIDRVVDSKTSLSKLERLHQADYISNEILKQLNRNYEKDTTIA